MLVDLIVKERAEFGSGYFGPRVRGCLDELLEIELGGQRLADATQRVVYAEARPSARDEIGQERPPAWAVRTFPCPEIAFRREGRSRQLGKPWCAALVVPSGAKAAPVIVPRR